MLRNKDVLHFANRNIVPSKYTYNQFYFKGTNLKYNQYSVQNNCIYNKRTHVLYRLHKLHGELDVLDKTHGDLDIWVLTLAILHSLVCSLFIYYLSY